MRQRAPRTLWIAIALESLRLTALTAAIATIVVAFAAGVQPLADGKLGPLDALKYMALAAPAMLQFVLPFAAGFGATLANHRMASENELTAAVAAGISRGSLLAPALFAGLALSAGLVLFNNFLIPKALLAMERLVRKDAARLIVSAIERGDSADLGGVRIHADRVATAQTTGQADEHLVLTGVVALATDEEGKPETDIAAQVADVWLKRDRIDGEDVTIVTMRLTNAVAKRAGEGLAHMEQTELAPWLIPSVVSDNPKFRTLPELIAMARDPSAQRDVQRRRRELASSVARVEAIQRLVATLTAQQRIDLVGADGVRMAMRALSANIVSVESVPGSADEIVTLGLTPISPEEGVRLEWFDATGALRAEVAQSGTLTLRSSPDEPVMRVATSFVNVRVAGSISTRRDRVERSGLTLLRDPAADVFTLSTADLATRASALLSDTQVERDKLALRKVQRRLDRLASEQRRLKRTAIGNLHERAALAFACAVMMVAGAVTAMLLAQANPLVVYLWSFLPSLLSVIAISGGENAVEQSPLAGLATLWGGVAGVGVFTAVLFLRLRRH